MLNQLFTKHPIFNYNNYIILYILHATYMNSDYSIVFITDAVSIDFPNENIVGMRN